MSQTFIPGETYIPGAVFDEDSGGVCNSEEENIKYVNIANNLMNENIWTVDYIVGLNVKRIDFYKLFLFGTDQGPVWYNLITYACMYCTDPVRFHLMFDLQPPFYEDGTQKFAIIDGERHDFRIGIVLKNNTSTPFYSEEAASEQIVDTNSGPQQIKDDIRITNFKKEMKRIIECVCDSNVDVFNCSAYYIQSCYRF